MNNTLKLYFKVFLNISSLEHIISYNYFNRIAKYIPFEFLLKQNIINIIYKNHHFVKLPSKTKNNNIYNAL
jgi:hypothetical protein